jgi:hypothetical protein
MAAPGEREAIPGTYDTKEEARKVLRHVHSIVHDCTPAPDLTIRSMEETIFDLVKVTPKVMRSADFLLSLGKRHRGPAVAKRFDAMSDSEQRYVVAVGNQSEDLGYQVSSLLRTVRGLMGVVCPRLNRDTDEAFDKPPMRC